MSFKSLALWIIIASALSITILFGIYCGILAGSGWGFEAANRSFEHLTAATPIVRWLRNIGVWGAMLGGLIWIVTWRRS